MKTSVIALIVAGLLAGAFIYLKHKNAPSAAVATVQEPARPAEQVPLENASALKPDMAPVAPAKISEPAQVAVAAPAVEEAKPNETTNEISKAVDGLLHAKSAKEKHELFQQLAKAGQLDQVIAELKERAAANPNDAEIPTTVGEALLNKLRAAREAGTADMNDMGIMAMTADQSFNAALKIDPNNWEANFVKASSQYYWPANPQMDNDVVQRLSGMIDRQDTMTPQPEFVQTYMLLAKEYDKIGNHSEAVATLIIAAQKYPGNPDITKALAAAGK